jgi:hypothetical protein
MLARTRTHAVSATMGGRGGEGCLAETRKPATQSTTFVTRVSLIATLLAMHMVKGAYMLGVPMYNILTYVGHQGLLQHNEQP